MNRILITAAALGLTATGALAYGQKTIDANEAIQSSRIEQSRLTGQLTRKEYRDLKTEQARIQEMEARAKSDGYVSKREYNRIHDAQLGAYSNIKSEAGDRQVNFLRRWLSNHR
jgi:uncharacterized membrane protein YebE (DUF533 family)